MCKSFMIYFQIFTTFGYKSLKNSNEFVGDVDRAYLIKFFGLRERDVEWFRIEEVQKD